MTRLVRFYRLKIFEKIFSEFVIDRENVRLRNTWRARLEGLLAKAGLGSAQSFFLGGFVFWIQVSFKLIVKTYYLLIITEFRTQNL